MLKWFKRVFVTLLVLCALLAIGYVFRAPLLRGAASVWIVSDPLTKADAIVVLGGMGNILGTLVGGILLGILQSLAGVTLGDGYRDLVGLVLFLAVLAVRPQGLFRGHAA